MRKMLKKTNVITKKYQLKFRSLKKSKRIAYHYADAAVELLGNALWPQSEEIKQLKITEEDLP